MAKITGPFGRRIYVSQGAAVYLTAAILVLVFGLYLLALAVAITLFHVSFWWGLAGVVAYIFKPTLHFTWR